MSRRLPCGDQHNLYIGKRDPVAWAAWKALGKDAERRSVSPSTIIVELIKSKYKKKST